MIDSKVIKIVCATFVMNLVSSNCFAAGDEFDRSGRHQSRPMTTQYISDQLLLQAQSVPLVGQLTGYISSVREDISDVAAEIQRGADLFRRGASLMREISFAIQDCYRALRNSMRSLFCMPV